MKPKIYLLFIVQFAFLTSQSQIIPLESWDGTITNGAYYKDTNNRLNSFEGTYLFVNGSTSLKVILQKKVMSSMNGTYNEDLLIGELLYIENGVTKLNTLPLIDQNQTDQDFHTIIANEIVFGPDNGCTDCPISEYRIRGGIVEPNTKATARIVIRKITQNSQQALKISFDWLARRYKQGTAPPMEQNLNGIEFILIKQ